MKYSPACEWDGSTCYGTLYRLGKQKGYELICRDRNGNSVFVKPAQRSLWASRTTRLTYCTDRQCTLHRQERVHNR